MQHCIRWRRQVPASVAVTSVIPRLKRKCNSRTLDVVVHYTLCGVQVRVWTVTDDIVIAMCRLTAHKLYVRLTNRLFSRVNYVSFHETIWHVYNIICVQPNRDVEMIWPDYQYRMTAVNRQYLIIYWSNIIIKKKTASYRNLIMMNLTDTVRFMFHYIRTKSEIIELSGLKR